MKFAHRLRGVQGVYSQFVIYKTLKQLINKIEEAKGHAESQIDEGIYASQLWYFDSTDKAAYYANGKLSHQQIKFLSLLENEIARVKRIHHSKLQELKYLLTDVFGKLMGSFSQESLVEEVDSIANELIKLETFNRQSKLMFYKILKKYDRRTGMKAGAWTLARLEKEDFWNCKFDEVVIGLSDAYAELRALETKEKDVMKEMVKVADDVETFERHTEKYMVKPENIMTIKLLILKRLPLDIFGRKKSAAGQDFAKYLDNLKQFSDSTVTNSIYLDNEKLQMYHERTGLETPRGNLIRVRWYGEYLYPQDKVFMERKTRISGRYDVDESVKERFLIKSTNVLPYMKGEWTTEKKLEEAVDKGKIKPEKADKLKQMSFDIQEEIVGKKLRSAVRTVCRRSAFQVGKDQSLRFSLDTNLHMIDETPAIMDDKWVRSLDKPLKEFEVIKFPFAVLEIKTQKEPPQWVSELINSGLIAHSPRFSKFQYGSIKLRPKMIRYLPLWYDLVDNLLKDLATRHLPPNYDIQHSNSSPKLLSPKTSEPKKSESKLEVVEVSKPIPSPKKHVHSDKEFEMSTPTGRRNGSEGQLGGLVELVPAPKSERRNSTTIRNKYTALIDEDEKKPAKKVVAPVPKPEKISLPPPAPSTPSKGNIFKGSGKTTQRTAKSFFANERTLLQWVNTVTFLSLTGLTLLNTDTLAGRICGVGLVLVTIAFAIYAYRRYKQRLEGLEDASLVGFQDRYGPIVLISVFCVVLLGTSIFYIVEDFVTASKG